MFVRIVQGSATHTKTAPTQPGDGRRSVRISRRCSRALAERHQVIRSRLVGHGRTAGIDRPIDIHLIADNVATLVDHLQLK